MHARQVRPHDRFPTGASRPIAELAVDPKTLEAATGLRFDEHVEDDGLGTFQFAALELPNGEQIWLGRHDGDQVGRLFAYADQAADVAGTQALLLAALELPETAVSWNLVLDLNYVVAQLEQTIGARVVGEGAAVPSSHLVVQIDRNTGTATVTDRCDATWELAVTVDAGSFAAKLDGEPSSAAIRALAWLDFDAGLRLHMEPPPIRALVVAEQSAMWPRWAEWMRDRRG